MRNECTREKKNGYDQCFLMWIRWNLKSDFYITTEISGNRQRNQNSRNHTHTHTHTHTERKWRKLAPVGAGGEYRRRSDWHPAPTACCVRERLGGRRRQFVVICRRRARVAPARDCCGGGGRQLDARLIKSMVNLNYNWKWNHFNQLDNVQL